MSNEKTKKQCCVCNHEFKNDETVWVNRVGRRKPMCECCAMEKHGLRSGTPCCGYCGSAIDGNKLDISLRDDDGNIFCDANCAFHFYGYTTI